MNEPSARASSGAEVPCDVAIITVKEEELAAVADALKLEGARPITRAARGYVVGSITANGVSLTVGVTRCSTQGNGVSADVAADVFRDLRPKWVLLIGIAGAAPSTDICLGDVALAIQVFDFRVEAVKDGAHDFAASEVPVHAVAENLLSLRPVWEPQLGDWFDHGMKYPPVQTNDASFGAGLAPEWKKEIRSAVAAFESRDARRPKATAVAIGSSDRLIKDAELLAVWLRVVRHLRVVEMESAGVHQAARGRDGGRHAYPVLSIRGVSDIVGLQRDERWTQYACMSAASYAAALLRSRIFQEITLSGESRSLHHTHGRDGDVWDTYPVFQVGNYQIPFLPFLRPNQDDAGARCYSPDGIRIVRNTRAFELPEGFPSLDASVKIESFRNDCCRLKDLKYEGGGVRLTIQPTTYQDYLRSAEHLDDRIDDSSQNTFRDQWAAVIHGGPAGIDMFPFQLTNVCGVGTFIITSDEKVLIRRQPSDRRTYPDRWTFSSSGTIRWNWHPDIKTWTYQNCFERIKYEVDVTRLYLVNLGFDTRRLYFQLCVVAPSDSTSGNISTRCDAGKVEFAPFRGSADVADLVLSRCWEPAAEVALLSTAAEKWGWRQVSDSLYARRDRWGRHAMDDEWDYRASRRDTDVDDLPVLSYRYDRRRCAEESRRFASTVADFVREDVQGRCVIDVGVGVGRVAERIVGLARRLVCIDLSEKMLRLCRQRLGVPPGSHEHVVKGEGNDCAVTIPHPVFGQDWTSNVPLDVALCCQVLIHNVQDLEFHSLIDRLCRLAPVVFVMEDVTEGRERGPHTRPLCVDDIVTEFRRRGFASQGPKMVKLFDDTVAFFRFCRPGP